MGFDRRPLQTCFQSKKENSGTDTTDPHQAPQHQRERQTLKESQNEQTAGRTGNCFPKQWKLCYPNLTEYKLNLHNY